MNTGEPAAHPEAMLLQRAVGGWRGMFDSGLPAAVFVLSYLVTGNQLRPSLIAALAAGVVILVWRLFRRQPLTQILAGFAGVAISAYVSSRTGQARDFFLWGLLVNIAYGSAFLISLAVRWPLMGVVFGAFTGDTTGWRSDPELRRTFAAATWIWVFVFGSRILVQVPMYLAGWVAALGTAKIIMGWPLFLFAAYLTYRVLKPVMEKRRLAQAVADEQGDVSPEEAS